MSILLNQVALVTGASRGIGRAIAIGLAAHGCDVALNYCSDDAGAKKTAEAVTAHGRRVIALKGDVSDPHRVSAMADETIEAFGRIDILVNNAGITRDGLLGGMPLEDIEQVLRTNLLGVIYSTQAVVGCMLKARRGRIINISSSAAQKPGRGQASYAAAKGGVEAFTRAMAVELAPRHILVNAVAPGVVVTDMTEEIRRYGEEEIKSRLLLKRYAEADEMADLVIQLASPRNRYMTGQVIHLDGGLRMA